MHWILPLLLLCIPQATAAQLVVRRPIDLGAAEPGQTVRCDAARCGEAMRTGSHSAGALYVASVSAVPLRAGQTSLAFAPVVTCLGAEESAGPSCTASGANDRLRWGLGGAVATTRHTPPGEYRGFVTVVVQGPEGEERLEVPVSLSVREAAPGCTLTQEGLLHFGSASAGHVGTMTLDPALGSRSLAGGHQSAHGSSYSMPTARIATSARHVLIAVAAPDLLQGPAGAVDFASSLAWRQRGGGPYMSALRGSGSTTLKPGSQGMLELRLGGRLTVSPSAPPGHYRGTVQIRYHCF